MRAKIFMGDKYQETANRLCEFINKNNIIVQNIMQSETVSPDDEIDYYNITYTLLYVENYSHVVDLE